MTRSTKGRNEKSSLKTNKSGRTDKLTLHPMEFEDALAVMLGTPPPPKSAKTATKKRTAKKR
jgi:hypothetical protein